VASATQIGGRLRVLVSSGVEEPVEALARTLSEAGIEADLERARPNLEDVFVASTKEASREPAA
jgi:hypothetical protein